MDKKNKEPTNTGAFKGPVDHAANIIGVDVVDVAVAVAGCHRCYLRHSCLLLQLLLLLLSSLCIRFWRLGFTESPAEATLAVTSR